jgi:SAM-dependent methyltransferase
MTRFGPDPHDFFDAVYQGSVPWEIGGVQPAMVALIERFPPQGPTLDLGCASGDLVIHLAGLGHEALGVDFVERAIAQANAKRAALPDEVAQRVRFTVGDASRPSAHGRFESVFDSGFLHLLDREASDRLGQDLAQAIVPGGRLYLHEFAVEFPVANVPRAVTEDELRERFSRATGWRVLHIAPAEFSNTVASPTPAIVACIERSSTGVFFAWPGDARDGVPDDGEPGHPIGAIVVNDERAGAVEAGSF